MSILVAIAVIGLLQMLFLAASFRKRRLITTLYCLIPGLLSIFLHPWVAEINFRRLTENLSSDSLSHLIASILILEAAIKALALIDLTNDEPTSTKWFHRLPNTIAKAVIRFLPYTPSVMFLFFIFYGQAWLFHTVEGASLKTLSLVASVGLSSFLFLAVFLLRAFFHQFSFRSISYDLLFLQLIIAIVFPLLAKGSLGDVANYDSSIYFQAAVTCGLMLAMACMGYVIHQLLKRRTQA
ncbi:MAG: hypothetical protein AAGH40_05730 [Verrucomicrobiota bacterium]